MNRRDFVRLSSITAAAIALPLPAALGQAVNPKSAGWFIDAEKGYDYVIGVHVGLGSDLSVISVLRVGKDDEPLVQVAELAWPGIEKLLVDAKLIGYEYGKYLPNGPMFSVEQITATGDVLQHQLKIAGFKRFYEAPSLRGKVKQGWYSRSWSSQMIAQRFIAAYHNGNVEIKSKLLSADIAGAKMDGRRLRVPSGDTNRFMAAAIAYGSGRSNC